MPFFRRSAARLSAIAAVMTLAAACGQDDHLLEGADDDGAGLADVTGYDTIRDLGVAIVEQTGAAPGAHTVFVGLPASLDTANLCLAARIEDCRSGGPGGYFATDFVTTRQDRKIMRSREPVTVTAGMTLVVVADGPGGQRGAIVVRFNAVGAVPGGGTVAGGLSWKAIYMTGDDSIRAFDNARKRVKSLFAQRGVRPENTREMSRTTGEQTGGVKPSSEAALQESLRSLAVGPTDACLVFLTSHGSREGFYLRGQATLTPSRMARILDESCGARPTVVLVSACYSGVFIKEPAMLKDNRIILTAARHDRTSFGCGPENEYTYWDNCLIDNLPGAKSWKGLSDSLVQCINQKESGGGFSSSLPQSYFGAAAATIPLINALP